MARTIRSELAARQVDWTDFAARAGQSKTTAWRKLSGKSRMSIDDVQGYADALGWSLDALVTKAREKPSPAALRDAALAAMSDEARAQVTPLLPKDQPEEERSHDAG